MCICNQLNSALLFELLVGLYTHFKYRSEERLYTIIDVSRASRCLFPAADATPPHPPNSGNNAAIVSRIYFIYNATLIPWSWYLIELQCLSALGMRAMSRWNAAFIFSPINQGWKRALIKHLSLQNLHIYIDIERWCWLCRFVARTPAISIRKYFYTCTLSKGMCWYFSLRADEGRKSNWQEVI